jgi:hypothetical protein
MAGIAYRGPQVVLLVDGQAERARATGAYCEDRSSAGCFHISSSLP